MSRKVHAPFCESLGVRSPRATHLVITGSSKELENELKPLVMRFLAARGQVLSEGKTVVTHIDDGFDFLGCNVRKFRGQLVIQPSKKNVKAFLSKVRDTLRKMCTARQADVIEELVPVIRGWANYHRSQMASRMFSRCDHQVWQALWRWACRRDPQKGARWIKQRYFRCHKGRDWRFAEKDKRLPTLSEFRKRPHAKVNAAANPHDPAFDQYFFKRLARKMDETLEGRRKLALAVVVAGRNVPERRPADHARYGVASSSRDQAFPRWFG